MMRSITRKSALFVLFLSCRCLAHGQSAIEEGDDSTLGPLPTFKAENLSPAGHCDNEQLTFFAPWADHYEVFKRRCDTGWIGEKKFSNTWFSQVLKPGVTGMIYKKLDERGTYQFMVRAYKGGKYRKSEIITVPPCINEEVH